MILALALACAPEPTPLPVEKPAVVLVVLDTTRADLGGAEVPEWWTLGRRYTRATSADTHTVASAPVLLTGRPQTEGEKAASLGGGDCQGQKRPRRNLPNWPADAWPELVITDQPALRVMGGPSPVTYDGPGSRHLTRDAVALIRTGGFRSLVVWSAGPHHPYDGLIIRTRRKREITNTTNTAYNAAACGRATRDQEGYLRQGYAAAVEKVLPQAEEVVSEALQAGAVVILTADHGDCLGEGGRWGHEGAPAPCVLDVPLVVFGPGVQPGIDATPVPATCVGETASLVLGEPLTDACDLRDGTIRGDVVSGMLLADGTWDERVILPTGGL